MKTNNFQTELSNLQIAIDNAKSIAIASHLSPDGDNLGSINAMYGMLTNLGKDTTFILNDEVPQSFKFLPYIDDFTSPDDVKNKSFDLFIALDCGDMNRLGDKVKNIFLSSKNTVNIDHHKTNDFFANINIVDVNATATCEVLFDIFKNLKLYLDKKIATSLYTGISTDTGSFKYDSVRPKTFEIAAELLEFKIDFNKINTCLYQTRSKEKTDLLVRSLNSIKYFNDDKIALVKVTIDDLQKTGAKKMDSDGIVEFVRDIEGVEVAVLLKEKESSIRLSMRSKSFINCSDVASMFNGGGHIRAAGGTFHHNDLDKAEKDIIDALMEEFNK